MNKVNKRRINKFIRAKSSGQGLVEYALILALAALVVIGVGALMGMAVQRIYGIVIGALGTNAPAAGGSIEITEAICHVVEYQDRMGLVITGTNSSDLSGSLVGSTNYSYKNARAEINNSVTTVSQTSLTTFEWRPKIIEAGVSSSLCPVSIVIQSGTRVAAAPVTIKVWKTGPGDPTFND